MKGRRTELKGGDEKEDLNNKNSIKNSKKEGEMARRVKGHYRRVRTPSGRIIKIRIRPHIRRRRRRSIYDYFLGR